MNQTAPAGSPMSGYVPPKDWEEITADEKIERMREIIKSLTHQVGQNQASVHSLRQKVRAHEHIDGKVYEMREIASYDDSQSSGLFGGASSLSNGNYF